MAYRREHKLPAPRPPAVLVQRMVDARAAGVAFSADPVSGRRGVAESSAPSAARRRTRSGEADADTWLVDRRGAIVERRAASGRPTLSDDEVRESRRARRRAERISAGRRTSNGRSKPSASICCSRARSRH